VAEAPDPLSVQLAPAEKLPLLGLTEKATVPPGVLAVPPAVSVTVAVQVVGLLASTVDGEQLTLVLVLRRPTVRLKVPLLAA
jgi:hypothetical protein